MGLACFLTGTFLCLRYHQDGMFSETWQRLTFAAAGLQPKTKTSDRAVIFNFWNRLGSRIMSMALRGTLKRKKGSLRSLDFVEESPYDVFWALVVVVGERLRHEFLVD